MRRILLVAMVCATALLLPAFTKKAHQHPYHTKSQIAPTVNRAPPYDWQAGDCDITNKTSVNTCTNGGR